MNGGISVVALANIQQARNAADGPEVELVETILAARECEDDTVFWHAFGEIGVIIPSAPRAITSPNEKEMLDGSGLDGFHHFVSNAQHSLVAEADQYRLVRPVFGETGGDER